MIILLQIVQFWPVGWAGQLTFLVQVGFSTAEAKAVNTIISKLNINNQREYEENIISIPLIMIM